MNIIFEIGLCLLPFENLYIAPSAGWASITPIIFLVYALLNYKYSIKSIYKYRYIFLFVSLGILLSVINYLFVGIEIKNLINATISLGLGLINLISIDVYFRQKKNNINNCVKYLLVVYGISIAIGWIQFLTVKFDIDFLKTFFMIVEKRSYIEFNRIQFTFTEPSFIGMHLFGILLPIFFYTKKKSIIALITVFAISAIIFSSGVRILIDIAAIIIICYFIFFIKNIKNKSVIITTILMIMIAIISVVTLYNTNYRVRNIINKGIYADGSLASRYFRINASIKGYINDGRILTGYGLGNSLMPIRSGYNEAMQEYKSNFLREMKELANPNFTSDSVSYCLYIRIISEFGVIFFVIVIAYLYKLSRKSNNIYLRNYIWILLYIYLQFESYAFYTIWLYIILLNLEKEKIEVDTNNE